MATINDGLVSMATSLGKRSASRSYCPDSRLSDKKLLDLYRGSWIIQKYIDTRASDMTRLDRDISTSLTAEESKKFEAVNRRLNVFSLREEALIWSSIFGEALIIAITNEEDLIKPIDLDYERILRFMVIDKTGFSIVKNNVEDDISSANFGKPRFFELKNSHSTRIHNSRVFHVETGRLTANERMQGKQPYGDIQVIYQPLITYLATAINISDIVDQSKTDVIKVNNFNQAIANHGEEQFILAAEAMRSIRSSTDALFIDANSEYEQKEMTFAGLVEILKSQRDDLSGASKMPLTLLFGQSAAGFASGEEDAQNYYQSIASLQESRLRDIDNFFDKFTLIESNINENFLDFTYPSIELPNEVEKSTILSTTVTALSTALTDGVISEWQYATELKNNNLVSSITDEDINELKELTIETETDQGDEAEQTSRSLLSQTSGLFDSIYAGNRVK